MAIPRDRWTPPLPPERSQPERVPGAMGGSLLWEQPAQAADRARLEAFVQPGPPVGLEIGFDHGMRLLAMARAWPEWRWLGVELRRRRVEALVPLAPDNCLPLRADARTLLATLLPPGRLSRVDILFPTPATDARRLLLSAELVADLARALGPEGVVHIETDVPAMGELAERLFAGWTVVDAPFGVPDLSRRQRVARRDGLQVWVISRGRPRTSAG